jgi:2-polyprenyl-3-methyl-5-hydroxy-6-metoxy-1,4-benzoquinol methylase
MLNPAKVSKVENVARMKTTTVSGRDYFEEIYKIDLEVEAQWLRYGAVEKVNSIEILLNRHTIKPITLLELGCGTGAVITECQRRGLGDEFTAVDYSKEAIEYMKSHSQGIHCVEADITGPNFKLDKCFDVVVLSHVLEHLEEPLKFLQSLMKKVRFCYLVVEVPLDDLLVSRIKNIFRDRTRNVSGHVHFFTEITFQQLLSSASLEIKDNRRYLPIFSPEIIDIVCRKDGLSRIRTMIRKITNCYLNRFFAPMWARVYYAHYAVLCVPPIE